MSGFAELLGQERLVETLRRERTRGRLAHAYLFEGRVGTGRLTVARALAAEVLCRNGNACGDCHGCRLLAGDNHPDLLELPRDTSTLSLGLFVDRPDSAATRGSGLPPVLPFLHLRPSDAERRVVIIPDAERMQAPAANALLKTLEEPPEAGLLLLTTSARERLPATVVSRCRRLGVLPLATDTLAMELERRGAATDAETATTLATLSEGSLGLALDLADDTVASDWTWLGEGLSGRGAGGADALARGWIERMRSAGTEASARRAKAVRLLDLSALWLRRQLREGADPLAVATALGILWKAGERIGANVRPELLLTSAAAECISTLGGRLAPEGAEAPASR